MKDSSSQSDLVSFTKPSMQNVTDQDVSSTVMMDNQTILLDTTVHQNAHRQNLNGEILVMNPVINLETLTSPVSSDNEEEEQNKSENNESTKGNLQYPNSQIDLTNFVTSPENKQITNFLHSNNQTPHKSIIPSLDVISSDNLIASSTILQFQSFNKASSGQKRIQRDRKDTTSISKFPTNSMMIIEDTSILEDDPSDINQSCSINHQNFISNKLRESVQLQNSPDLRRPSKAMSLPVVPLVLGFAGGLNASGINTVQKENNNQTQITPPLMQLSFVKQEVEKKEQFLLANESIIEGVKESFRIQVVVADSGRSDKPKTAAFHIDGKKEKFKLECSLHDSFTEHIPAYDFIDIEFNAKNKYTSNFFTLHTSAGETYEYVRFQGFEEASFYFQDAILSEYLFHRTQQKPLLFQHKKKDLYVLKMVEETISIKDILDILDKRKSLKIFSENECVIIAIDMLNAYAQFIENYIAVPDLSRSTIVINMVTFEVQIACLHQCFPSPGRKNSAREQERQTLSGIFEDILSFSVTFDEQFKSEVSLLIKNGEISNAKSKCDQHMNRSQNTAVNTSLTQSGIQQDANKSNSNNNNNSINNSMTLQNQSSLLNGSAIFENLRNSQLIKKQVSLRGTQTKQKLKKIAAQISSNKSLLNSSKNRSSHTNFFACERLSFISRIYSSLYLRQKSIELLEQLRDLQATCYGIDSQEYARTISTLCHAYCSYKQYQKILPNIEKYTQTLRSSKLTISSANDLFTLVKIKVRYSRTSTIFDDIDTLFEFLKKSASKLLNSSAASAISAQAANPQSRQNLSFDISQLDQSDMITCPFDIPSKPKQNMSFQTSSSLNNLPANIPQNKKTRIAFTRSKLHYLLGCRYSQEENFTSAISSFEKALSFQVEDFEEHTKRKLSFLIRSEIVKVHYLTNRKLKARALLSQLQEETMKFANPVFFNYLGIIEYEDTHYIEAFQYLKQAYVLREDEPKCSKEYVELLFTLCQATRIVRGPNSSEFLQYSNQMRVLTGDHRNFACLSILAEQLLAIGELSCVLHKLEAMKSILNLLNLSEKQKRLKLTSDAFKALESLQKRYALAIQSAQLTQSFKQSNSISNKINHSTFNFKKQSP